MQLDDYGIMFDLNEGRFPSAFKQRLLTHKNELGNRISLSELFLAIPNLDLICHQYKGYLNKTIKPAIPYMHISTQWNSKPFFNIYFDLVPETNMFTTGGGYIDLLKKQERWFLEPNYGFSIKKPIEIGVRFNTLFSGTKEKK